MRAIRVLTLAAAALTAAACTSGAPEPARTLEEMAREVGAEVVTWLRRGYVPGRSGEIALVARPRNVVTRRGSWVPGEEPPLDTSHATPWAHHQRVPIVLSWGGPAVVDRPADVTEVRALLEEALRDDDPPALVVVVVLDGGGWNLLEEYPDAWPTLRSLMAGGTVYTNATVGSSPSVTAPVHASIGTGTYPRDHGIPDNTVRLPSGEVGDPWFDRTDPGLLRGETLADRWDRRHGGRAWVGLVATEPWHVGMLGHGAGIEGGDRDVAVLWDRPGHRWFTNERFYALPPHLPDARSLEARLGDLDASDGTRDGRWLDNDLGDPAIVPATPAFVEHQAEALLGIVAREPIGQDEVPDILLVELKSTDRGAHVWNLFGEEEAVVLRAQDDLLRDLIAALDRRVGRGRWALVVTADHGLTPLPEAVGGLRVHPDAVARRVEERFGPIVDAVTPASIFLDLPALREAGVRLDEVARFVGDLRYADGLPDGVDLSSIPEEVLARRTFAAALPGPWLASLREDEVAALGPGRHPAGDLTTPPPLAVLGGDGP